MNLKTVIRKVDYYHIFSAFFNQKGDLIAPREKDFLYPLLPNAEGNFQLKIPTDFIKPGYCEWFPIGITYRIQFKRQEATDVNFLFYFERLLQQNTSRNTATVTCTEIDSVFSCKANDYSLMIPFSQRSLHISFKFVKSTKPKKTKKANKRVQTSPSLNTNNP